MLNRIWAGMIVASVLCAVLLGRMGELSQAILEGSQRAVTLTISMTGMMCAWTGLLRIGEAGGLTRLLARLFSPVISRLFPGCRKNGPAMQAMSMNITANLLGMGNAATPLGIAAMKALAEEAQGKSLPSREMIRFVVLNTASIQLIPTYMAALRAQYGSTAPFEITPAVWVVSAVSLVTALTVCRLLEGRRHHG